MDLELPSFVKEEYPFESNFIDIDSQNKLHYIDQGSGKVILMLHGNPTWSYYYRHLIKELSKSYRVIVPDHIGCGLSSKPQDYEYTLSNHIQNIQTLLSKLSIERFSLIVHDWGGAIGLGVATQRPHDLESLILLNTAAFPDPVIPKRINILRNKFGEKLIRHFNVFAWPATFMAVEKPLTDNQKKAYLYPYSNFETRIATAKFVQDIPMSSKHPSWKTLKEIEQKLPQINAPKLILWGAKDFCFNMHYFERWRAFYPDAKTQVFKSSGHYILEDSKDEVLRSMQEFLNDI